MSLTPDQVAALAPDASALAAARKVAAPGNWKGAGHSPAAVWGECQGSAVYQVRVDTRDWASKCTCPSRKFPCKHALGLLLLHAGQPAHVPAAAPPPWVEEWLGKRGEAAAKREARPPEAPPSPEAQAAREEARARRAGARLERVAEGLEGLELFLEDLVRAGLAGLETRGPALFEAQAARLVDAQTPGLAARVRRLARLPGAGADWPERLLAELGRLALLTEAFRRRDALGEPLWADVRAALGLALAQEDVLARGERVTDAWWVGGQSVEDEERLRVQRTWLWGLGTGRGALVLHFSAAGQPFPESFAPGTVLEAELAFFPAALPQRALVVEARAAARPHAGPFPGAASARAFLDGVADALARQPWVERLPCALRGVRPTRSAAGAWALLDAEGGALPLRGEGHWRLLALSGGHPLDVVGEWDGEALRPLGASTGGAYEALATRDGGPA